MAGVNRASETTSSRWSVVGNRERPTVSRVIDFKWRGLFCRIGPRPNASEVPTALIARSKSGGPNRYAITRLESREMERSRYPGAAGTIESSTPQGWKCGQRANDWHKGPDNEAVAGNNHGAKVPFFDDPGVSFLENAFDSALPWREARERGSTSWLEQVRPDARRFGVNDDHRW
jgi:hypothetical protein